MRKTLAVVFFFSGAASLIFQVAWQRLLTLHYGVGPISISLIVSVYMLGLGLGSLLGGYIADRTSRTVLCYLAVECLLAGFGLLSLPYLRFLGDRTAGSSYWVSFLCIFCFLCVPTLAMGMALPLIVKTFSRITHCFLDSVAHLYFINTLGAAAGSVVASYGLISFLGLDWAVYVASGLDFLLGVAIYLTDWSSTGKVAAPVVESSEAAVGGLGHLAYVLVFVTGFVAIGFELTWFRVIEVLVKASPYAFSSMLAVFLMGLACGSRVLGRYLKLRPALDCRRLFFLLQFGIGAYVLLSCTSYYYLTRYTRFGSLTRASFDALLHPSLIWPSSFSVSSLKALYSSFDIFLWPFLFTFIPTVLMGASFPLISTLAMTEHDREGSTVGTVYFWNTVGNALGGLVTGFVILPVLGTEITLLSLSFVSVGMLLFTARPVQGGRLAWRTLGLCAFVYAAATLAFPRGGELYEIMHPQPRSGTIHIDEGIEGVVVTWEQGDNVATYINGLPHGGRPGFAFYRETAEAVRRSRRVDHVLVVGFGTGSIVEAMLKLPEVRKVTLVELNSTLLTNLRKVSICRAILDDPRVDVVADDGRRFLLRTPNRFDMILTDPLHSTTAYSNNLYSQEFFELAGARLAPGGVLLSMMEDEDRVMPKTLAAAFRHVRIYSYFSLGSNDPLVDTESRRETLLEGFTPEYRKVIAAHPVAYLGSRAYVDETTAGYPVNHDWRPCCEYFIGLRVKKKLVALD